MAKKRIKRKSLIKAAASTPPYNYTTGTNPNENVIKGRGPGPLPADVNAVPFDANYETKIHEIWLTSENPQIYPGQYTIAGTWAPGDEAIAALRWNGKSIGYSYIIQIGDGPKQIAEHLRNQMANDSVLGAASILVMPVGQYGGGWSWQVCPPYATWIANPRITLSTGKTSQGGMISTPLQPSNVLDTPACTLVLSHRVPGRQAQADDLIGEVRFMGQTDYITDPNDKNLRQIYANLQVYIKDRGHAAPMGRWQFQNASGNENNVVNAMMLANGLLLCDANGQHPAGGNGDGFMGAGSINLPAGGHIYRDGVQIL